MLTLPCHSIITDPKDVQLLYAQATDHQKAYAANTGWMLGQVMHSGVGLINGDRWTNLRLELDPYFNHKISVTLAATFNAHAKEYVAALRDYAKPANSSGEDEKPASTHPQARFVVNAAKALTRYPYYEIAKMFYGDLSKHEADRLWELGHLFGKVFWNVLQGGANRTKLTKWRNTPDWQLAQSYLDQWEEFNAAVYQRRIANDDSGDDVCLFVRLMRAAEAGRVTRDEVLQTLAESLFANLDVTTHVITSLVLLLADNAEVTAQLREEFAANADNLDEYLGKRTTLLYYCLLESLRLQPVIDYSFPEKPPRDKILGGYRIPKGVGDLLKSLACLFFR